MHLADLGVHERNGGVVTAHRLFLAADVHLHVQAGLVVDTGFRECRPNRRAVFPATPSCRTARMAGSRYGAQRTARAVEQSRRPDQNGSSLCCSISSTAFAAVLPSE